MGFELERLGREDLRALVALKLFEELGLGAAAAERVLASVNDGWMRGFLHTGPPAIGQELLGFPLLKRARLYRERASGRLCLIERARPKYQRR